MSLTAGQRALYGRLGAAIQRSRHDPHELTRAARDAFMQRFERQVREASPGLPWVAALPGGGMPPHQYVVIRYPPPLPVDVLLTAIRRHPDAFDAYFRGYQRPMRYLELPDGMRYWRTVLNRTHMLNRGTLNSVEAPRRIDQGAKPIPWEGPPWAPYGSPWPPGYFENSPGEWVYRPSLDPRRAHHCSGCAHRYWLSVPDRPCPRCGTVP